MGSPAGRWTAPELSVSDVAFLVDDEPRRIEGWCERKLLRPTVKGRGPGRHRTFSLYDAACGAVLRRFQLGLGERHPFLKRAMKPVPGRGHQGGGDLVDEGLALVGLGGILAGHVLHLLAHPEDRRDAAVAVAMYPGDRQRLVLQVDDGVALPASAIAESIAAGAAVLVISVRQIATEFGARLAELEQRRR